MEVNQDYKVTSSSHRWRIDNFSKLMEKVHITSPTITVGHDKWEFMMVLRPGCDYLSFYVCAVECKKRRYAKFHLTVKDQISNKNTLKKEGQMIRFAEFKNYGGFDNIIQLKELNDPRNGYIVDDVCIIEVKICINSAQKSKEELVPMEVMESIEERDPVTISPLVASTSKSLDNHATFICAFCQTSKVSEGFESMWHFVNGKHVKEDEVVSGLNVIHVHKECIEWSVQVNNVGETPMNLERELARCSKLICSGCGLKGASLGCYIPICMNVYHVPCAFDNLGCRFDGKTRQMICPNHSRMMLPRDETKNPKKLGEDDSSPLQRSNWDKNESLHSNSRKDDQLMPTPASNVINVTPKPLKESDGYEKYSIAEIKARYHLDERFEVAFVEGEEKLTDSLIMKFPYDKDNLLIAVGQLEAGLRLPLYYPENPFYYEVLCQRTDKRGIFQYTGNFFRFLHECRNRSEGRAGTTILPFRQEDYTATNFNWTWSDSISKNYRFPWCVVPRRIASSKGSNSSGKVKLLSDHKGIKRTELVRLEKDEKWFLTPLRIKGPWVTGWLTPDARAIFDAYPPYEPWTLNMVGSAEMTYIPHDSDESDGDSGSDSDGGDDPDFTPVNARQKRKLSASGQTVKDASAKRSRPHRLDVRYSGENTEAVEIPNVDSVDACPASTPLGANIASELQTNVTDAGQASGAVNIIASGVEQTESHMFGNPFVAPEESEDYDVLMQSATLGCESTLSFLARLKEYCKKSHKLYHSQSKDFATRLSGIQREKDLLVSEVCHLKTQMQGFSTRAKEAEAALAKQIEATNSVQEKLTGANARIQEVESLNEAQFQKHADVKLQLEGVQEQLTVANGRIQELETLNQDQALRHADVQLQLEGIQEQVVVANARIQELENLNRSQALQHADAQLQMEGYVEGLKLQIKRTKEVYSKLAKDQVNQAFDIAESSGMMKPGEKFKRY